MEKLQLKVGGIFCSFCVESIRKAVGGVDGVAEVRVSHAHEDVLIHYDPDRVTPEELTRVLRQLGYVIRDPRRVRSYEEEEEELRRERRRLVFAGILTLLAALLMLAMWLGVRREWFPFAMLALALANVFGAGGYILRMAAHSLRRGILNQHVLMELAAFSGLVGGLAGLFVEGFPTADFFGVAVFVTTYHILSGYTSLLVRTRASQAVRRLLSLQPAVARVLRDGREREVPVEEVGRGELVLIKPGEGVPVDGVVVSGASSLDESLVTGESMPVEKFPGDEVIGGSVNLTGSLVVRVTRVGEESFLQQVARHIEEARALKPGVVQLADRVLKYYVPGVVAFALLGFTFWTLGAWLIAGEVNLKRAAFAMLAALVMGYPCALGMATPLAIIRGSGEAAERGILLRSPQSYQALKDVSVVVLDKTGTLTKGTPRVAEVLALEASPEEVLKLAASAERLSEHPLARATVEYAEKQGIILAEPSEFVAVPGGGVRARVEGRCVAVGSLRFLRDEGVEVGKGEAHAHNMELAGRSVVGVAEGQRLLGIISFADTIREDACAALSQLRQLGMKLVMVTGDSHGAALAVAKRLGIESVHAGVLPQQKAEIVRSLQEKGEVVAFVGDGINDAPALMQADVGMAMSSGTDVAIESADVVLVGGRLSAVPEAYHIAGRSYRKTLQNLAIAFSFNGIGVPLATTGMVHPYWAMFAMLASVSGVLLNSFAGRLLPGRAGRKVTLLVSGMHCEACVTAIEQALRKAGVREVSVDPGTRRVEAVLCGMGVEDVKRVLGEAGFSGVEVLQTRGDDL